MTEQPKDGTQRRYVKLRARAEDQRGTPEGDLCHRMADAMRDACPALDRLDAEELPTEWRELKWKTQLDLVVLRWVCEYNEAPCSEYKKGHRGRGRSKMILVDVDDPTNAAIEQSYEVLKRKAEDLARRAVVAFMMGAMPLAPTGEEDDDDDDDDDEPDLDMATMSMLLGAREVGRGSAPRLALEKASE